MGIGSNEMVEHEESCDACGTRMGMIRECEEHIKTCDCKGRDENIKMIKIIESDNGKCDGCKVRQMMIDILLEDFDNCFNNSFYDGE